MKRIICLVLCLISIIILSACNINSSGAPNDNILNGDTSKGEENENNSPSDMKIVISDGKYFVTFKLNNGLAALSLYNQLPFTVPVSNYASNEKIFTPPKELDTRSAVNAVGGAGVLAYFSPWKNMVMYYGNFSEYNGLYALGNAISGTENIAHFSGKVTITKAV